MATQPTTNQRFRVTGSGYTLFSYDGSQIMFCQTITDSPPRPIAEPTPVQPLDELHPIEIAFPRALSAGSLQLEIIEEWDREVWAQFPGYEGLVNDLADIFRISAEKGNSVTCLKTITAPSGKQRVVQYHGCVITDVGMGESIQASGLTTTKTVTITYTHVTRKEG